MIAVATALLLACCGLLVWWGVKLCPLRRGLGLALVALGALTALALALLATLPFGIGEPLLRLPQGDRIPVALGAMLLIVGIALPTRRAPPPAPRAWLLPVVLFGLAAGLGALTYLSTPVRERERDAAKRTITLPPGFSAEVYLQGGTDNPTVMTFGPGDALYLGDIAGTLWRIPRTITGTAAAPIRLMDGFDLLVGLAWIDDELFVSSAGKIEALRDANHDGVPDSDPAARRLVIGGLPNMVYKPHSNNSLTVGPDGRLYFGVGGTSNDGIERQPLASAILSVSPDGGPATVVARGLGNPFEVAFNARGDLFSGDNSPTDPLGGEPPDSFHYIVPGAQYPTSHPAGSVLVAARPALLALPAHSSPTGLTFYTGTRYPDAFRDNAFLALWNRGEVLRIQLRQDGADYVANASLFGDGFLYPIDVVTGPDGDLYIADFGTGVVYRIRYTDKP